MGISSLEAYPPLAQVPSGYRSIDTDIMLPYSKDSYSAMYLSNTSSNDVGN